eukprot:NODE_6967_length_803_cov_567.408824_g6731_i0.p1 GENE.NODE_6967_length_803_cov_567.408824_g6731_i0~~NODE_6967_length_803_cov_567.408824_g6731_i0.p1  ORF type:complete len:189 (+),score=20.36 NODE_6967_length_803_cov_567.408824_g6731_i0:75-641(+)
MVLVVGAAATGVGLGAAAVASASAASAPVAITATAAGTAAGTAAATASTATAVGAACTAAGEVAVGALAASSVPVVSGATGATVATVTASTTAATVLSGPVGWILVGARENQGECSWDCWKQIVGDSSSVRTSGVTLRELASHAFVKSVQVEQLPFVMTNHDNISFRLDPVVLPCGNVALHATAMLSV